MASIYRLVEQVMAEQKRKVRCAPLGFHADADLGDVEFDMEKIKREAEMEMGEAYDRRIRESSWPVSLFYRVVKYYHVRKKIREATEVIH